jgi:hypothetical protein
MNCMKIKSIVFLFLLAQGTFVFASLMEPECAVVRFNRESYDKVLHFSYYNGVPYKTLLNSFCADVEELSPTEFRVDLRTIKPGMHDAFAGFLTPREHGAIPIFSVQNDPVLAVRIYKYGGISWGRDNALNYVDAAQALGLDVQEEQKKICRTNEYWEADARAMHVRRFGIYQWVEKKLFGEKAVAAE